MYQDKSAPEKMDVPHAGTSANVRRDSYAEVITFELAELRELSYALKCKINELSGGYEPEEENRPEEAPHNYSENLIRELRSIRETLRLTMNDVERFIP